MRHVWLFYLTPVPLNNKKSLRQHSISSEREDDSLEGLEEPLKAKKRRESSQGSIKTEHKSRIQNQYFFILFFYFLDGQNFHVLVFYLNFYFITPHPN